MLEKKLLICLLFMGCVNASAQSFRDEQRKFSRVEEAWQEKKDEADALLKKTGMTSGSSDLYIRVFKQEEELEVWGSQHEKNSFIKITTIPICSMSGGPGPKRREGDLQVPEGFYHINVFNPNSNFFLSLGINYPNSSDKILSDKTHPGGAIFIHGNCVSIGCMAIRDENIKLLYVLAVEARSAGQAKIPVHIFPCRMEGEEYNRLVRKYQDEQVLLRFWEDIRPGYLYFEETGRIPEVKFLKNGKHQITKVMP
jgi:murein L,D-transpeptidase YafK